MRCDRGNSVLFIVFFHKLGSLEAILPENAIKENVVQLEEAESPPHQAPKLLWGAKEGMQANGETGVSKAPLVKLTSQKG